jgi:acetyl-CoA carboxylase carboxyl transferase subunit alpha
MPPDTLEFEEPIAVLLKEIEALSMLPTTPERQRSIDSLYSRVDSIRVEIYKTLTPWQRVLVARHPNRPTVLDYVSRLFTEFVEISGDRRFSDDHAIVAGYALYKDEPVLIVGHHKGGGDTKQKIYRNFGYARPEGYRKALRVMKLAEKYQRAVIAFIDTPRPIRGSSQKSEASRKPSPSICARWPRSTPPSSLSFTVRVAAAARSASPLAIAS